MTVQRLKTAVLALLVAFSVALSYELWHGLWSTPVDVALSGPAGLGAVSRPNLKQSTRPYRVLEESGQPAEWSVGLPASPTYNAVLGLLQAAHLTHAKSASTWKLDGTPTIEVDFGAPLARAQLLAWLPGVARIPLGSAVNKLWLYTLAGSTSVQIALQTDTGFTLAQTDLSAAAFRDKAAATVAEQPWTKVGQNGYLPTHPLTVQEQVWTTTSPQLLPLVSSFFVNPAALTRVSGPGHTVIWTDGSRAVQWNQSSNTLAFSDPNAPVRTLTAPELPAIVAFLQNHGGTPGSAIAMYDASANNYELADTYTFRPYINGLPLLGEAGNYTVDWLAGSPVGYQRPLTVLGTMVGSQSEQTLPASALIATIDHLVRPSLRKTLQVQLSCAVEPGSNGNTAVEPVVEVTSLGHELARIDAVTGAVVKGGTGG